MTLLQQHSTLRLRSLLLSLWLPLCLMLIGYGIASYFQTEQELQQQQRINHAVQQRLEQIAQGVREKVTLYQYGLRGTRGAVMTVTPDKFSYADMQTYTYSRDYKLEFPGARGFGLVRRVAPDQINAFLARMQKERPGYTFNIKQLQPHDGNLFIIQYVEPESRNSQAVGLDIGSEPMRRQAALDAALHNDVRLTAPITLVQANEQSQQGFLMLMPVYQATQVPTDASLRLQAVYGWSYAPILINEVLSTLSGLKQDVALTISDISDLQPLMFFSHGQAESLNARYQQQQTLTLFGRTWDLTLTPTSAFITALHLPATNILFREILGMTVLITLVLYLLQLLFMRRNQLTKHKAELAQMAETTLRQANAELEQQVALRTEEISRVNTLQRSILSGAGYAIIATDTDGLITAFNPAAEQLLGYKASEVIHKHTPAIFHLGAEVERHAAKVSAELGQHVDVGFDTFVAKARSGKPETNRWTYVTKDGDRVQVKLNVSALMDEQARLTGYLGIAFDLTEQLKHEAELARAKEQAEIASKAKSDFLANMSHEIRTPMNAILGLLQLVANTSLNKRQSDYIEKTQRAAKSLLSLLNDILDFSKVEAGKLELDPHQFSLPTLMQDIGIILSSGSQQKDLEVLYHIASDVPKQMIGDSLRLKQVLLNLAGNAIKFTEHGEVVISISATPLSENKLRLNCSVRDTGIGMTPAQQQAIFSGFHQAESSISRRYGGTGLGLAISKRLVNLMQGNISVISEPDKGSDFRFDIIVEQAETAPLLLSGSASELPADLHVLIVDDNDNARLILQEMALSFGWQADTAAQAAQALAMLEHANTKARPYSIVFVDWRMPGMDGLQLAEKIKHSSDASSPPLVVMITAYGREILTKHIDSYQQLLDGFLIKPVTHEVMLNTVQAILAPDATAADVPLPASPSTPLQGLSLLLVEDNLTNQLVASELLQAKGADVDIASGGAIALEILQQSGKRYDLVLMDIQMPEMDGYETTRRIRQLNAFDTLPIIAMTANALPSDKAACLAAGMQDHIAKPFDLNEVIDKTLHYCQRNKQPVMIKPEQTFFAPTVLTFCQQHQIKLERACARLGHSAELYLKVLHQFSVDLQQALQTLQHSTLSNNTAKILFHSLKGAASTVGFSSIATLMAAEETAVSISTEPDFNCSDAVLAELAAALPVATSLIDMLQPVNQIKDHANQLSRAELQPQLDELLKYLTSSNMATLPLFQQLYQALQQLDAQRTEQMDTAISNLAFEHAAAILRQMLAE
jgi:PAS domain S-box-containing protein